MKMTYKNRDKLKIESIKCICTIIAQIQLVSIHQTERKTEKEFMDSLPKYLDFIRDSYVEMTNIIFHDKPQQKILEEYQEMKKGKIPEPEDILDFTTNKTIKPIYTDHKND